MRLQGKSAIITGAAQGLGAALAERLAKEGRQGAQVAIALADDPARMLAAVQIGFTTTAMLAGIFSGATLAERLEEALMVFPILATYSKPVSIVIMTVGVTYTALVIGELVPKHIALNNPESIAIRVAQPLALVAKWPRRWSGCLAGRHASSWAGYIYTRASNAL